MKRNAHTALFCHKDFLCYHIVIMPITIPKKAMQSIQDDDAVLISRTEYERLRASQIPTVFLKGKAARRLDARVTAAIREYRTGKLKPIQSLRALV